MEAIDVPLIVPRDSGNAYELARLVVSCNQTLWMSHKQGVIVTCRRKPASDFTRLGCLEKIKA